MRVTSLGVHERSVDQVCTWASFKRRLLASMHGLTTATLKHACAHHGAPQAAHPKRIPQACMCSPRRPTSCASEAHPQTMGIGAMLGAMLGAMRLAVWRLPRTTEAVCSTTVGLRSVPAATYPPRAARADVQRTVGILRAPHINSRRARYDVQTSRAVGSPFGRPTPALWYRARFPSRRAVSALVSLPFTCRRIPRTYAGPVCPRAPGGRGGVGRRESRGDRALRLVRPALGYRPAGPAARAVGCASAGPVADSSPFLSPFATSAPRSSGPYGHRIRPTATAHTSQIDVIYTHITSWRRCTR